MVEKAGTKVGHVLTDSDPWSGQDCPRERCWLCETKSITGKNKRQECTKRNLVYETYCMNCESEAKKEIETAAAEGEGERQEQAGEHRREDTEEIKLYKYIGETCRSVWERATEHLADLKNLSPASHLLKHILDKHEGQRIEIPSQAGWFRLSTFKVTTQVRWIIELTT